MAIQAPQAASGPVASATPVQAHRRNNSSILNIQLNSEDGPIPLLQISRVASPTSSIEPSRVTCIRKPLGALFLAGAVFTFNQSFGAEGGIQTRFTLLILAAAACIVGLLVIGQRPEASLPRVPSRANLQV